MECRDARKRAAPDAGCRFTKPERSDGGRFGTVETPPLGLPPAGAAISREASVVATTGASLSRRVRT